MQLEQKVYTLDKHISRLSNGADAALRRGQISGEFWIILSKIGEAESRAASLERWHTIAQCIALAGQNKTDFGTALRQVGLSDARITRLLDADPEAVPDMLLRIARRMRSQNVSANWLSAFMLIASDKKAPRYRIAREYYVPDADQPAD